MCEPSLSSSNVKRINDAKLFVAIFQLVQCYSIAMVKNDIHSAQIYARR